MTRTVIQTLFTQVSTIVLMAAVAAPSLQAKAFDETDGWISMNQALQNAMRAVPETTPFHIDLDVYVDAKFFEIKSFKDQTLYNIQIDPVTGLAAHIDSDTGPGAQSEIADAQYVMSQSMFTLDEALVYVQDMYPNYFITELAMMTRNGVPIFNVDLVRGLYRLEVRIFALDGDILKEHLKLMSQASWYNDLYIPDTVPDWNLAGLRTPEQMINIAHNVLGGKVFYIELKEKEPDTYRYEVRVLKQNLVISGKFNARAGTLISSEVINDIDYASQVKASIGQTTVSLYQAITTARTIAPNAYAIEAKLNTKSTGKFYQIEFLTTGGILETKVNATTGAITRMEFAN